MEAPIRILAKPCLTCGALSPNTRCPTHAHLTTGARGSTRRSRTIRDQVIARDNYQCQTCGRPVTGGHDTHIDHVTRKRHGGTDDPTNLRTTCQHCNLTRG